MRRRRSPLKPDNFPFLAVLLCAMGSLILLLLVMDRRAKAVARAKALQTLARQAEDEARVIAAAERAAAQRRAEWEHNWQARHALLEQQERDTRGRIGTARQRLQAARQQGQAEEAHNQTLLQKLSQLRGQLSQSEQALTADRGKVEAAARQADRSRGELAELTRELQTLEQILKKTKEAREREQRTFSLVPYHGKHGDSRRPVYVECTAAGVIFHPDKMPLEGPGFGPSAFRAEVERRIARLAGEPGAGNKKADPGAYLLFLIRPDGIDNYYRAVHCLAGLEFDFGYEFIDPDWVLDFPAEEGTPAKQPWMITDKADPPPAGAAGATPPTRPGPHGMPWPGGTPRGVAFGKNVSGSGIEPGGGPEGPLPPGRPDPRGSGTGTGAPGPGSAGRKPGSAPEPWLFGGGPGTGGPGSSGPGGGEMGQGEAPRGVGSGSPGGANGQVGGPGVSGGIVATSRPGLGPGVVAGEGSGTGQGTQAAGVSRPAGNVSGGPPSAPAEGAQQGTRGNGTGPGNKGEMAGNVAPGAPAGAPARTPGDAEGDSPGRSRPAGIRYGGGEARPGQGGDAEGAERTPGLVPSLTPSRPSKPPSLPPVRVVGNRDWVLRVECQADAVVLYPSSKRFATATLTPDQEGGKELVRAVQQMIARRQATVRPGELPYRPQLRFLVRPDGVRTFFLAYPVLEVVGVPMNRQDVERDEDVR
jgi:hypothetical protein